jgi:hypothetical protein
MDNKEEVVFANFNNNKEVLDLAKKLIFYFFTINSEGILSVNKETCSIFGSNKHGWFSILPDDEIMVFLRRILPRSQMDSFYGIGDCDDRRNHVIESLKTAIKVHLMRLGVKNPYVIQDRYMLFITIPDTNSGLHETGCDIYNVWDPDLKYNPTINSNNVFGIRANKIDGSYETLLLFNSLKDALKFRDRIKVFYYLVNCKTKLDVEYFDLNNSYKPNAFFTDGFGIVDGEGLENGVKIELIDSTPDYHFQKSENFSIITVNNTFELTNDVFQYSSFGSKCRPSKLLNKIIEETEFDFTNVVVEQDNTGRFLYLINFNQAKADDLHHYEPITDFFMAVYYFNTLGEDRTKFVAIDIWDLAVKLSEYVEYYDFIFPELSKLEYVNIGIAYQCIERFVNNSNNLKIITVKFDDHERIVVSDVMGGRYSPIELQVFDNFSDEPVNIWDSEISNIDPTDKIFEKKAVKLQGVYLKNTFGKKIDKNSKETYGLIRVIITDIDSESIHELDKSLIDFLNENSVYIHTDGSVSKPFENGKPVCPVSDFSFFDYILFTNTNDSDDEEDFETDFGYGYDNIIHGICSNRVIGEFVEVKNVNYEVTKVYRPFELLPVNKLHGGYI